MKFNIPVPLAVEITSRCNLSCPMCGFPVMKRGKADMELSLYKKIVDECCEHHPNKMRIEWLHAMGEALLHPKLVEILDYTNNKLGYSPSISTNGVLIKNRLKDIVSYKNITFMVGLSSMDRDVYNKIRVGGDYDLVIYGIHLLIDSGYKVTIQKMHTIYNDNETQEKYRKEFGSTGYAIEEWNVNRFKPATTYIGFTEKKVCYNMGAFLLVYQDGRVPICCFDYDCTTCVGNVNYQPILDIAYNNFDLIADDIKNSRLDKYPACKDCLISEPESFRPIDWKNNV